MKVEQLALQRKRYAHLSDEEWRWMLQQVEGRQRTCDKLPTFAQIADWWYPVRLSCEQCSSEATARYKAQLISSLPWKGRSGGVLTDLTGGYGVDTYFMSEHAQEAHYIEQNAELCRIATHNFALTRSHVQIHNTSAESFLASLPDSPTGVIYMDPARRDKNGDKVFRLEDCEPNVVQLLPTLTAKSKQLIIKLSPMLDITQALRSLPIPFDVHIVAVNNEVKEVLLLSKTDNTTPTIHAINLQPIPNTPFPNRESQVQQIFSFTQEEEKQSVSRLLNPTIIGFPNRDSRVQQSSVSRLATPDTYLYEPNAAIIKAGAFKLVAQRFGLCKMAPNTHLYYSEQMVEDFPGRVWRIMEVNPKDTKNICASILTRNYPLTPDQLRKKLKVKEGDLLTIIGARLGDKPTLFLCEKI